MIDNTPYIKARVTAVYKERYEISSIHGQSYAQLKTSVYYGITTPLFPTTGDYVHILYNELGDSQIVDTLERKTYFSRRDPDKGRGEQAVAANFDTVFIVQSLNHDFNLKRLERYATLSWQSGANPVILLTKSDLIESWDEHIRQLETTCAGIPVIPVSAVTGYGIEALQAYCAPGQTVVLLGSSGVGKSSLVNAMAKEELMAVNEIREDDSKGRHTTTHRQLITLPCGAMIIDTPGMRELGMWDVSSGLGEAFVDVEEFLGNCRFSDCRHESEPGCGIKTAIDQGDLSPQRWESYLRLEKEARYAQNRSSAMREKAQRHKEIAKWNKQNNKNRHKS